MIDAWGAAKADAGVSELDTRLYLHPNDPGSAIPTALLFAPGIVVVGPEGNLLSRTQRDDANQHLDNHRIMLYTAGPEPVLLAKLRHELEHVRQWQACGRGLFDLYHAISAGVDEYIGAERRGSGVLYNIVPLETDANAAASDFIRRYIGTVAADALADSVEGVLFRQQQLPEDVRTLGRRAICFASLSADRVEQWLGSHPRGARALIDEVAGDPTAWDLLGADEELVELIARARELVPDQHDFSSCSDDFRGPWRPLQRALLEAYSHARTVVGLDSL